MLIRATLDANPIRYKGKKAFRQRPEINIREETHQKRSSLSCLLTSSVQEKLAFYSLILLPLNSLPEDHQGQLPHFAMALHPQQHFLLVSSLAKNFRRHLSLWFKITRTTM